MPNYQHQIDKHLLFPIERRGDTLIVTPKGDPGSFANLNFNLEHSALLNLMKTGPYRNLLVDLSGSNYFGAKVLGAIAEWAKKANEREGRVGVCGASADMRELLHLYGFENQWPQFPTREAGIKAIVTETSLQTVQRQWKWGVGFVLILGLVGLGFLLEPHFSDRAKNERDYQTVMEIWEGMQALKSANASATEWRIFRGRARSELEPIVENLEKRAGSISEQGRAAQCLFHAGRHYMLDRFLVERDRLDLNVPTGAEDEIHWQTTEVYLAKARKLLDGEDPNDLKFPQQDLPPGDPAFDTLTADGDSKVMPEVPADKTPSSDATKPSPDTSEPYVPDGQ